MFDNSGNELDLEDLYLSTCDSNRLGLVSEDEKVMGLHVLGPKMALTNNPGKRLGKCEFFGVWKYTFLFCKLATRGASFIF